MEPLIGTITYFAGGFEPGGWAFCHGQELAITKDTKALFSLIGTTYGGDGEATFHLPDLRGRVAADVRNNSIGIVALGGMAGEEVVTLNDNHIKHDHPIFCATGIGTKQTPGNSYYADEGFAGAKRFSTNTNGTMARTSSAGGGAPHQNMQPYLVLSPLICISGRYPSRY